ncbi:Hypothetical predicted protein [Paramuricea clavata]|uniref:PiggyBac transposable element-derived protein domain-containing protein n=1 Tax=Paramuricea clavata TaxID=317549 RepID=A0A6S7H9D0_PARCT|nr:Hypothetical predicted protein [Paramuricea clavata]
MRECQIAKKDLGEDFPQFDIWFGGHQEQCTQTGSRRSMECSIAKKMGPNVNESLNSSLVWNHAPKHRFKGPRVIEIAAMSAVLAFNCGAASRQDVMKAANIPGGNEENMERQGDDENEGCQDETEDQMDELSESDEDIRAGRLKRRQLTKNRIVNSIDKALDINNYNPYQIPKDLKDIESVVKVDKHRENDVVRVFQNKPPTANIGRNNRANVITGRQGPQPKARVTPTPRAAFELFFTEDIMATIVSCTSRKIRSFISTLPDNFVSQNSKYAYVKETCVDELYAIIGLYIYRGLYKLNTVSVDKLFSNTYGPPIFSATMSRNRFTFIRANLCFDDSSTRDDRWKQNRFAAIREIFESFNFECMSCLVPNDYLSLDETLYPMRNQISFKQYNPNKPAKYGLLFKAINAARYPYTLIASPYCGKPTDDGESTTYRVQKQRTGYRSNCKTND